MKVALLVTWCLVVIGGANGGTRECCCGYGTLCLDFGQGPINVTCTSLDEQCGLISKPFYRRGTDCNTLKNACTSDSTTVRPCERGTCVPTFGSYFCECPPGWYGQRCSISDPALDGDGVKNPVYIYYQVQTGRKGERIPFHLIYDPGPQNGIMKLGETGVKVKVEVDDGRTYYPMRRTEFKQLNVKEICLRDAEVDRDLYDIRVCNFLPEGVHWAYSFDPKFHTEVLFGKEIMFGLENIGTLGNVRIRIQYLLDGMPLHTLYDEWFPLFTYSASKVLNRCKKIISFEGCQSNITLGPNIYLRGNTVDIKTIVESRRCEGTKIIGIKWLLQRGSGFDGKYDPVPKSLEFGGRRSISFPPRYFTDGEHLIELELTVLGDPPHYGGPTIFKVYGRCSLKIELGPIIIQAYGGNFVSSLCSVNLNINLISLNPSMLVSEMRFTISCHDITGQISPDDDPECEERNTEVPFLKKFHTPCNTIYEYSIVAEHFITRSVKKRLTVVVHFVKNYFKLAITCLFNCFPIDSRYRIVVVASTDPYVPATVLWSVVVGDQLLDTALYEPNIQAFFPLSTTRVLRIDGTFLHYHASTLITVQITASVPEFPVLVANFETVSNDQFHEISKFVGEFISDPHGDDHRIQFSPKIPYDVHFEFGPAEYRLVQVTNIMKDSLDLARGNYYETLSARPDFDVVMLCVHDSMMMMSCTPPMTLNNIKPRNVTNEEIEELYEQGNDRELLIKSALGIHNEIVLNYPLAPGYMTWTIPHLKRKAVVMRLLKKVLEQRALQETDIQAIIFILTMVFFSTEANYAESLHPFADPFEIPLYYDIPLKDYWDWMGVRFSALQNLHKITEWTLEYGLRAERVVKLIDFQYGDILDGIVKCWNMAHLQSIFVKKMARRISIRNKLEVMELQLSITNKRNNRLLLRTISTYAKSLYKYAREFYSIRSIGTLHTRFWMVKTTYRGILAAFNRSNTGEDLPGYCDYIFGPVYDAEQWLQYTELKFPDVDKVMALRGKKLVIAVGVVGNRLRDRIISPNLIVSLTSEDDGHLEELPGGEEYEVTLPILIDGTEPTSSSKNVYESELLRPSNDEEKYKYYSVYKITLPSDVEQWTLRIYTSERKPMKVTVKFHILPEYEEVENTEPLNATFSVTHYISKQEVVPEGSGTTIPQSFYVGMLLTNEGKMLNESVIYCVCDQFGIIRVREAAVRITKILMADIQMIFNKPISPTLIILPIFVLAFVTATIFIAHFLDQRYKKQVSLIPMYDTHPLDSYPLIVGVFTSHNLMAGTKSTVVIKVEGLTSSSRVHVLKSESISTLKSASDDWFLMATNQPLGKIQNVLLWHDHRGLSNWYCKYILLYDIIQETWYIASVNRWFRLYPVVDDSRMAQISTTMFDDMGRRLKALPRKFKNQIVPETRNSHYFFSMFFLHQRSMYSYENRALALAIKLLGIFFGSWVIILRHPYHDDPAVVSSDPVVEEVHLCENTAWIILAIDMISYTFTLPYMLLVRSTFISGLIQKKTTTPLSTNVIRKEQFMAGDEKKDEKKGKSESLSPEELRRSMLHRQSQKDRTKSLIWMAQQPEEERQSRAQARWKPSHHVQHSSFKKLVMLLFGPCQFRCIDVSSEVLEIKMRKRIFCTRLLAGILICALFVFFIYVELFTNHGAKHLITIFYVLMVISFDSILINPIIILLNTFAMFIFLQTSEGEYQFLSEHVKLNMPRPLSYLEYFHTATKKSYKPLLSSEIENAMKKSSIYHSSKTCILNGYLLICIILTTVMLMSRYDTTYYPTVRTITAAAEKPRTNSLLRADIEPGTNIREVTTPQKVEDYIPPIFGELNFAWPNGVPMDDIVEMDGKREQLKIPKYFTKYFSHAYGFLSESKIDDSMIVLSEKELNYTDTEAFHSLSGKSRSTYRYVGNEAVLPTSNWREYYLTLTTIIKALNNREDLMPRALIFSYNIVTANTFRLSAVELVIEFLPSGECSANIHVSSTKVRVAATSSHVALRFFVLLFGLALLGIAVVDISTMGFANYITQSYGITKFALCTSGIILFFTTFVFSAPKYWFLNSIMNRPSDEHLYLHSIVEGDLFDSCALAIFLLFSCVDFAVSVIDALCPQIIVVMARGFRILLTTLLIIMLYSRAAATCANTLARNYNFMVLSFSGSTFPLSGKNEEKHLFFIFALPVLCIFSKFCLAIYIYHFEVFDRNYVSDYHSGRPAEFLSRKTTVRRAIAVRMQHLKKLGVYVGKPSTERKSTSKSTSRKESERSKSVLSKSKPRKTSEPLPNGERKLKARQSKLYGKSFNWF